MLRVPPPLLSHPPMFTGLTLGAAALLSYAACGPGLPSQVPLGGTENEPALRADRAISRARASTDSADTESDAGVSGAVGAPGAAGAPGEVNQGIEPPPPSSEYGGAKAGGSKNASGCDDSGGSVPDCDDVESGACGAIFGPVCQRLARLIKPRIASAVTDCLAEKNRVSECAAIDECLDRGLELSCPTATDEAICRGTLRRCGKSKPGPWHEQRRCERALGAFETDARTKVVECLNDSCKLGECLLGAGTESEPKAVPRSGTSTRTRD